MAAKSPEQLARQIERWHRGWRLSFRILIRTTST